MPNYLKRGTVDLAAASSRLWVPSSAFGGDVSTLALVTTGLYGWLLDPTSGEIIGTTVDKPYGWAGCTSEWFFTSATAATGGAVINTYINEKNDINSAISGGDTTVTSMPGINSQTAFTVVAGPAKTFQANTSRLMLQVFRNAAHANDTLAVDLVFHGVRLTRA